MYEEIYIDVVFFLNFFMDYMLLTLIGSFFFHRKTGIRFLAAALIGAFFSCALILFPYELCFPLRILLHGFCGVGLLCVSTGIRKNGLLWKGTCMLYLAAFTFGGFYQSLQEEHTISGVRYLLVMGGFYLVLYAGSLWKNCIRAKIQNVYLLTIYYRGKKWETPGFYDTGNLLYDPVSASPVSIIRAEALGALLPQEWIEKLKYIAENPGELEDTEILLLKPHIIPFCSIGGQSGMLVTVTLEELRIHTPKEVVRIPAPVFALQYAPSALGKEYEVLINSRLLR